MRVNRGQATDWYSRYESTRHLSERILAPLSAEDCAIQSMADASPTRWHLAHTTWFFETFLLKSLAGYEVYDVSFEYLFNSYYNAVGEQFPRSQRGLISRPGLKETLAYRRHVDQAMADLLAAENLTPDQSQVLAIGLNHEQQHQELMLTDIQHVLSCNPLDPIYQPDRVTSENLSELSWISVDEALAWIGTDTDDFAFDNERPRHRFFLDAYRIANRCVTNGEYLAFMSDGGYERPEFWLSQGWNTVREQGWRAPMYWSRSGDGWNQFTLAGRRPVRDQDSVSHVSYFEADAYARWAGCRLPTEQEWEYAVLQDLPSQASPNPRLGDAIGNLWQWTASQYIAYPGYRPPPGALGEYNGKFMCNQFVLRGGSHATPPGHIRPTYRNFFPPEARWQFSGIRLARNFDLQDSQCEAG